eukprot:SAG11_NODE_7383_length_1152_cov_1.795821_1_plen_375_part_01
MQPICCLPSRQTEQQSTCPDSTECASLHRHICDPSCAIVSGVCGACLDGFYGQARYSMEPCTQPTPGDGSSEDQAAMDCASIEDRSASGIKWLINTNDGSVYQAYCDMETFGGGWTLAAVVSNTDGQDHFGTNSWWSTIDCELQGLGTPTPVWTSGNVFGDLIVTVGTTANSKSAAYFSVEGNSIMIREVQGSEAGMRAYSLNTGTQTLQSLFATTNDGQSHDDFVNRATCSDSVGSSWLTSAFMQYETIDVNYLLTNDGAVLASSPADQEATSGLACRVDGHCGYAYDGNVCQGGPRHYANDAIDTSHTIWLYVRQTEQQSTCPDSTECASLHRHICDPSCAIVSGVCGDCLDGFYGQARYSMEPCTQPTPGDG